MKRSAAAAALLGGLVAVSLAAAQGGSVNGAVGPGFTISLKTPAGKVVRTLKAGKVRFTVRDRSSIHNFQVQGPGSTRGPVRVVTLVGATGAKTVTYTLRPGTYRFYCAPHASQMFGFFTVTS